MPTELALAWRDYRLTRMFPHWSLEQLRDAPHAWLDRMLKCDEVAAEVAEDLAEKARRNAGGNR